MKRNYGIGLFIFTFLFVFCLGIGYQLSYQHTVDKQKGQERQEQPINTITTKGEAKKNEGYYLKELNGYVAVYFSDQETLYELTEISLRELPEEVQEEVRAGKFVKTQREMYGFLENYSS